MYTHTHIYIYIWIYVDIAYSSCYLDYEFTAHGIGSKFWTPLLFHFLPPKAASSSLVPTPLSFQPPLLEQERKLKEEELEREGHGYSHVCLTRSPHIDSIFRRLLYADVQCNVNYLAYSYSETKERGRIRLLQKHHHDLNMLTSSDPNRQITNLTNKSPLEVKEMFEKAITIKQRSVNKCGR